MNKDVNESIPLVAVLLATHNPGNHIDQQIHSITSQLGVRIKIYWGDFNSSESRKTHVRGLLNGLEFSEYVIQDSGAAANFFHLLGQTSETYVAFADQDDIWLPNKLISQVNQLLKMGEIPSLTHSTSEILIGAERVKRKPICRGHDFQSLIFANCCQGCTMMINSSARRILLQSLPSKLVWHDWWIGLVLSLTGEILYTEDTQVLYRIHEANSIGLPNRFSRFRNFLERPSGNVNYQFQEAMQRFESFYPLDTRKLEIISASLSQDWRSRFPANLRGPRRRSNLMEEIFHRISWMVKQA